MLNVWNSIAPAFICMLLYGTAWIFDMGTDTDFEKDLKKSMFRINFELVVMQIIMFSWVFSPIILVALLIAGKCASDGDIRGVIPIK